MEPVGPGPLKEGFGDPSNSDFGNVPFWWWDGDELSEERITDQLETLSEQGVEAVCFEQKYPHGPPEGPQCAYFSEEWWGYMEHAIAECDRLGMNFWIHDLTYHHSPPSWKRYWQTRAEAEIDDHPEFQGQVLTRVADDVSAGERVTLDLNDEFTPLSVAAYPRDEDGRLVREEAVQLAVDDGRIEWTAPEGGRDTQEDERDPSGDEQDVLAGDWHVAAIGLRPEGLRRTSRDVVDWILEEHYGEYEKRLGDALGDTIVGTFQDELYMLQGTIPCDEDLLARHRAEWGEDPISQLIALFEECTEGSAGFRTRYYDVVTTVLEENWFRPLFEWHERRGLRFAHDNYGRNDLTAHATEYGDYFRTMRWFQEPGYDDGRGDPETVGDRNFFDGKVAASIAACYGRDRVWGELYHTTGWGYPPKLQYGCMAEHVTYGLTRYNKHGLYYSTLGGWYEHAPPDTHFRQPYWEHAQPFYDGMSRLMYLFSQGEQVVDLALHYPITSIQSHWRAGDFDAGHVPGGRSERYRTRDAVSPAGQSIDERTREIAETLFDDVADLLFVDDDSLVDGGVSEGSLDVAGMAIPTFVLGPTATVRRDVLETASDLLESGGVVVSIGDLPTATVEGGDGDDHVHEHLVGIFGKRVDEVREHEDGDPVVVEHESGGVAIHVDGASTLDDLLDEHVDRDVRKPDGVYHTHRRVGDRDLYLLLNTRNEARTVTVDLRADGRPERWDLQTGEVEPMNVYHRGETYTTVDLDFAPYEFHVLALDGSETAEAAAEPTAHVTETSLSAISDVDLDSPDAGPVVRGRATDSGRHTVTVEVDGDADVDADGDGDRRTAESDHVEVPDPISLDEGWTFELEPTMENTWGDFRYPPSEGEIGPEVREFEYLDGSAAGSGDPTAADDRETVRPTYGPRFWRRTASVSENQDDGENEGEGEDEVVTTPDEDPVGWEPYAFSQAVGKPGTHPDDHGFNGVIGDDFLVAPEGDDPVHFWTTVTVDEETEAVCHYGKGIRSIRVDGEPVGVSSQSVERAEGAGIDWLANVGAGSAGEVTGKRTDVTLSPGRHAVHVVVDPDTRTHVAFEPTPASAHEGDMAHVPRLRWFHGTDTLTFDHRPWDDEHVETFSFALPAGTTAFAVPIRGDAEVRVDGDERAIVDDRVELETPLDTPRRAVVRTVTDGAAYGGAIWRGPVAVETAPITVDAGDWHDLGLGSYSGIGVYRRTVTVPDLTDGDRAVLDLGDVAVSASVRVNGEHAGTTFAPPFEVDVTDAIRSGENEIEVRVANTVANHFADETPTRYVFDDQRRSGLHGPASLRVERGVRIRTGGDRCS